MYYVAGVPFAAFADPIHTALTRYSERSDGRVTFDRDAATQLKETPEKPNTARSTAIMRYLGEPVGSFVVIAFAPGDGTGDESAYKLSDLRTGDYPAHTKNVPRSKKAVHTEAHLTIAAATAGRADATPVLFAGSQQLLGLEGNTITRIGTLGQNPADFHHALGGRISADPTTTLTVGYRADGERFADPHAVYNPPDLNAVQVCGFIALAPDAVQHLGLFTDLGAREPR